MSKRLIRLSKAFVKRSKDKNILNAIDFSVRFLVKKLNKIYIDNYISKISDQNFTDQSNNLFLNPLISILIVSYDSGDDLIALFDSINQQTYKNIEVVLLENGKTNSEIYLKNLKFPYKYISSSNIGFASGNNLAFEYSTGDYICLVNPDTFLKENVIEQLLMALLKNKNVAISVPKLVFYEKYFDIEISSDQPFNLDLIELENSLLYKKYFIEYAFDISKSDRKKLASQNNLIKLKLPVDNSKTVLKLNKFSKDQYFYYKINNSFIKNDEIITEENYNDSFYLKLNCDKEIIWWGKDIINNAGSEIRNNIVSDRGIGEYDIANYEQSQMIDAFCGCVAMISPLVFTRRKIFIDEFFAYFEDSELSNWVRKENLSIQYSPTAIVRHKHSASSTEGSILWKTIVQRSQDLYEFLIYKQDTKIKREFFNKEYLEVPRNIRKILKDYDLDLISNSRNTLMKKKKPSAGIYNSYWNTMGGGEKHALSFAKLLSQTHDIYLISEQDFDENRVKRYFSIDFKFRKFIHTEVNTYITSLFDVFVNSTYNSSLISSCPKSFYLVSFPHKANTKFVDSYMFLHNSNFTKKWANKYWGNHKNTILYPILEMNNFSAKIKVDNHALENKNKNFISIGRFTRRGHAKRQDFILEAFKEAQRISNSDFNLFLIGSLDYSNKEDVNYYKMLESEKSKNIHLFPNLEFTKLLELLSISKIYLHANGVEKNSYRNPECLEHFGMSVIEALSFNNYPVVYDKGGPAETVKLLKVGETFDNLDSLIKILIRIIQDFNMEKYKIDDNFLDPFNEKNIESINLIKQELID